jgi:protein-S-isoprenylcysteine O-methyltransferase Ste14
MIAMSVSRVPQSWPAFLVGLIVLTYWIRVLQLVRKTKRDVGRAANFIPPERLGRMIRVVWIPVVALWVIVPLVTVFLSDPPAFLLPIPAVSNNPLLTWPAFAIATAAYAVTWVCWIKMGKSWRMGIDPNEKTQLILTGPYAYVRHPIYGLSSLIMMMTMIVVCSPLMLIVGVLHILFMQWEVRREDKTLVAVHGAVYADYQAKVGRFFPKFFRLGSANVSGA